MNQWIWNPRVRRAEGTDNRLLDARRAGALCRPRPCFLQSLFPGWFLLLGAFSKVSPLSPQSASSASCPSLFLQRGPGPGHPAGAKGIPWGYWKIKHSLSQDLLPQGWAWCGGRNLQIPLHSSLPLSTYLLPGVCGSGFLGFEIHRSVLLRGVIGSKFELQPILVWRPR